MSDITTEAGNQTGTPPYLALPGLEKLLGLLSTRSLTEITGGYLKAQGFGYSDSYLAMGALRFLGIVDATGKATPLAKKFHLQGDARKKEIEAMVRNAYSSLFSAVAEPHKLEMAELKNEFTFRYNLTPRVVGAAVPAFLWLCEQAGLKEGSLQPRKRAANNTRIGKNSANASSASRTNKSNLKELREKDEGFTTIRFPGGVELKIPNAQTAIDGMLEGKLKRVKDAINEFERECLPVTRDNESENEIGG